MDQKTFTDILRDVLIPYVDNVRKTVSGNKHAVLLVDGHTSRYSLEGIALLRDPRHDIDLVIIPAHTSHVAQPLDLGLNHFIKLFFRQIFPTAVPGIPFRPPEPGRPAKRRRISSGTYTVSQVQVESAEEMQARVSRAVYRRAKVVHALVLALEDACSRDNICGAFLQAHLVPLTEDPPYTREKEEALIREALAAGIPLPKETDRKKEHIIGIVTYGAAVERIKQRPDLMEPGGHKRGRPSTATPASPNHPSESNTGSGAPPDPACESVNTEQSGSHRHKRGRKPGTATLPASDSQVTTETGSRGRKRGRKPSTVTVPASGSPAPVQSGSKGRRHGRISGKASSDARPTPHVSEPESEIDSAGSKRVKQKRRSFS